VSLFAIVPIGEIDPADVRAFFARIPEGDRTFFREDVLAPGVVEAWTGPASGQRFGALLDGDVVGYLALVPGVGWSAHVAEIRIVVNPEQRRSGIGRALARHAVLTAAGQGTAKLTVHVVAEQQPTIDMFAALGFSPEGLLKDHVRSASGEIHDLLLLSHDVDELWDTMSAAGISDAVESS
jgi:ribosomal protein S18 acetylase RimI-like enzyme